MVHRPKSLPVLPLLLVLMLTAAACGDDADDTTGSTSAGGASTVSAAPTELRFSVESLVGAEGKVIVVNVSPSGGGPGVGTACLQVDSDPWSGMGVVTTAAPDNPCNHDAPYGVVLSVDGAYSYSIGLYTPGQQIPETCGSGDVTVEGPTEVTLSQSDFTSSC